jgi:hypothetical protein
VRSAEIRKANVPAIGVPEYRALFFGAGDLPS